ncbi:MAG: glycoside hydrolase family 57 protein [Bacteroidales bacterium]|jgi:alpha-amylase|nr:glycoside hydrolase family 57 protein [Bacteroidales bacterium]
MKTICFYFQIHQPFRLKRYRFFDIGADHYYYDDYNNETIIRRIAERCYLPANRSLLEMIQNAKGKFKVAFSITGMALEQFEVHVPEVIDSFRELEKTGCVEFLAETYAHSLTSLIDEPEEFIQQVKMHEQKIELLFGQKTKVFRNTELIYSDEIASIVASMGYDTMITEGAKHILGWKSPNYLYHAEGNKKFKLLLKNSKLSDDIAFRFSNYGWDQYPLTADKYISWIAGSPEDEQLINLFMNYEALGEMQRKETGIFEFFKALPHFAEKNGIGFSTPSEVSKKLRPIAGFSVPYPISWADEERDTSAWLGNILQKEAFEKLNSFGERVRLVNDRSILHDWLRLQSSDHFFYMCTKHFSDGVVHAHYSPYDSPYEAFNNYMNVLSDLIDRVNAKIPSSIENEELNSLMTTIWNQDEKIESLEKELKTLKSRKKMKEN